MNIDQLSLREKIGQMIMCGFDGAVPTAGIEQLIQEYHLGGIIYFRRNVKDIQQVKELSQALQSLNKSELPLLISIDQEGGMVARIDEGITLVPGNMALGATGDANAAYQTALISGEELRHLGINMNFAPCIDVNNNSLNPVIGVRSYGESAELVAAMGSAAIRGFQQAGVAATAKHFPGHGDTDTDSHLNLPSVPHNKARLNAIELVPFKAAIAEGVDVIMSAHVVFPAYEPESIPATLSNRILTGLLREELQYKGIIVTDCLEMNAISHGVGIAAGAIQAVLAGTDIVLVSHLLERQIAAFEALAGAVETGVISEERINQSVIRILALKQKRQMAIGAEREQLNSLIGTAKSWGIVEAISEKSITLVKDEGQLPLDSTKATLVIWPEVRIGTEVDEVIPQEITLGKALSAYIPQVQEITIGITPTADELAQVLAAAEAYDTIVIGTYNVDVSAGQIQLIDQLSGMKAIKLIVAALRNPYDLQKFPQICTYLACYENRPMAMKSLAKVLMGIIQPQGKLPVSLNLEGGKQS
ncbi:beta-N-acetylhexosaminidase [Paenibacillus psychroresistens]|uniref:Beta-N-acetylhexosaminidase n=1 Tax=Paenibacillus psychroresistens TaxID=1778678 RepID=A0A6B8RU67_9BACL|nr:beta-N-acetylhexosaminidase [Paenibacillus psychroresistens]QGQ99389.1 beta-N-acetylhexosaminidase [Paenibacillus psychroresistens]